ncbi:unnamed protein product [Citrullus colocynthis]|uniref:Uncharacterized protein n=1 Tax=Citrullus colocynthis TaxID=252529 RepID=A0ABP0YHE5_9ROSI
MFPLSSVSTKNTATHCTALYFFLSPPAFSVASLASFFFIHQIKRHYCSFLRFFVFVSHYTKSFKLVCAAGK